MVSKSIWEIALLASVPTFVSFYVFANEWAVCRYGWPKFMAGKLVFYAVFASAFFYLTA